MDKTFFIGREINTKESVRGHKCRIDNNKFYITSGDDNVEYEVKPESFHMYPADKLDIGEPKKSKTNKKNIKELQEILVQTCIDYINKNNLYDIYNISFYADDLKNSAKDGKWTSSTDSHIRVEGIEEIDCNGVKMDSRFLIGESF